jgi:hypothetical protein
MRWVIVRSLELALLGQTATLGKAMVRGRKGAR